jgi:hypothetical protein
MGNVISRNAGTERIIDATNKTLLRAGAVGCPLGLARGSDVVDGDAASHLGQGLPGGARTAHARRRRAPLRRVPPPLRPPRPVCPPRQRPIGPHGLADRVQEVPQGPIRDFLPLRTSTFVWGAQDRPPSSSVQVGGVLPLPPQPVLSPQCVLHHPSSSSVFRNGELLLGLMPALPAR